MEKVKQKQILVRLLKEKVTVTNMDIMRECGVSSPTKLISDMRKAGYDIRDFWEEGTNRYGQKVRYKKYWLNE